MPNVPDVSPSYALLPSDALHSFIGKGETIKIKEEIRCKNQKITITIYKWEQGLRIWFLQFKEKSKGQLSLIYPLQFKHLKKEKQWRWKNYAQQPQINKHESSNNTKIAGKNL